MFDVQDILDRLPSNYIKDTASNLGKLFSTITDGINNIVTARNDVGDASDIDRASNVSLDRLGENVQEFRGGLSDDKYRALIKAKIQSNLSPGDVNSIIEYLAAILQLDRSDIELREVNYRDYRLATGSDVEVDQLHGLSSLSFLFDDSTTLDDTTSLDDTKSFETEQDSVEFFEYIFDFTADYENAEDGGEFYEPAIFGIGVPISETPFTQTEIEDIVQQITAAGVKVYYLN